MIQTLPCPACHRTLVLAAETSLQAVLRCRHCSHQFVLGEMVEAELGFWEVVDDPNATEPKVTSAVNVNSAADEPELELAKSEEYVSPQTLAKKRAEKKNVDWSKFEPISHDQYERMRRKTKSPIWSMLSVLLGGLASIPIATLLIWHVLGKDPLQMGPVVGRYVPWVVPTRFQPFKPDLVDDNNQPTPPVGASRFRRFDDVMNASPSDAPDQTSDSSANTPSPAVNEASEPSTTAEKTADNVFARINQVEKDLQAWNKRGDDREANKKLAYEAYANLSVLALAIDDLPAASPQRRLVRTELNSVGKEVSQHSDIQQLIQYCSAASLTNSQGDRIGLAIVTKVAVATETVDSWLVKPSPTSNAMQIVVPKEIIPSLSAGENLLVIGSLKQDKPASTSESIDSSSNSEPIFTANYVHVLEP